MHFKSEVVKLPDEPSPVPEGISARVVISILFEFFLNFFKTSFIIGCLIFSIELVFSLFEYFKYIPFAYGSNTEV